MLISSRAAAAVLADRVSSFEQARHLLRTGVAGPGERVGGSTVYDEGRVLELAARPLVAERGLCELCPNGGFVARIGRDRGVDVSGTWKERAVDVARQRALPRMSDAVLGVRLQLAAGRLPWVATVSGFVVFGGEATTWRRTSDGAVEFVLEPPGGWFTAVEGRWFPF